MFQQTDLRLAKRTQIVGRVNFEFAAEALNVFNQANFVPNGQSTSTTLNNWRVTTSDRHEHGARHPAGVTHQLVTKSSVVQSLVIGRAGCLRVPGSFLRLSTRSTSSYWIPVIRKSENLC